MKSAQSASSAQTVGSRQSTSDFRLCCDKTPISGAQDTIGIVITEPSAGRVTIKGRVASLLEVGTGFHPELTGRENIYLNGAILGMARTEIKRKFDEIVAFAEIWQVLGYAGQGAAQRPAGCALGWPLTVETRQVEVLA